MGSFLSHTDMQSGSPGFGGPEVGHRALRLGPDRAALRPPLARGRRALTSSQSVDAQAAFEGLNTMLPAFLAGANLLLHTAGWLESGLVACTRSSCSTSRSCASCRRSSARSSSTREQLVPDAHAEVGHGGHFFGTTHTLENFRDCFYRPLLFSTENFERWKKRGSLDAADRAAQIWRDTLDTYEQPHMDPEVLAELEAYMRRRRTELGD